jgi:hypothetical protein
VFDTIRDATAFYTALYLPKLWQRLAYGPEIKCPADWVSRELTPLAWPGGIKGDPAAEAKLAQCFAARETFVVQIIGYTDSDGSAPGSATSGRRDLSERWRLVDRCRVHRDRKRQAFGPPCIGPGVGRAARLHRASLVVSKVDRLTRSVVFLSRLLEAGVDVRFADLPQIEGATGRFLLQQMVAVIERN